jgi:HK97 family phage major capsid protein
MKKNDLRTRFAEVKQQVSDIYKAAKNENRGLTEEESAKVEILKRELGEINADMMIEASERAAARVAGATHSEARAAEVRSLFANSIREAIKNGGTDNSIQLRASSLIDKADAQPLVALTIGDIIGPLEKGMVLDKVGCHIQTGLTEDWAYPVVEAVEATVAGEAVAISDSDIEISAVKPTPQRVAVTVPVTRTALAMTDERLYEIVTSSLQKAIQRTLNNWMFARTAIASGINGLFVNPTTVKKFTGAPTYADVCGLVGAVDGTGIVPSATAAFVMNNAMRATLKATPRVNGGERMIIENDMIDGVPVFVTEYATEGTIEYGYFSYALVGQFGDSTLIVDPYTLAKKNQVQFTLNSFWDIKPARAQAFGVLEANA